MAAAGPPAAGSPRLAPQATGPDGRRVILVGPPPLALFSIDLESVRDIKHPDRTGL